MNEYFQRILDLRKVLLDALGDCRKQLGVQPTDRRLGILGSRCKQLLEVVHFLDARYALAFGAAVSDVIQRVLQQLLRILRGKVFFADLDKQPDLAVNRTQQHLHTDVGIDAFLEQTLHQRPDHRPETPDRLRCRCFLQRSDDGKHALATCMRLVVFQKVEQAELVMRSQPPGLTQQLAGFDLRRLDLGFLDIDRLDIREKQDIFGQQAFLSNGAQIVHQRQQHHRRVPVSGLQPLEIVRQLQHRTHQDVVRVVVVFDFFFNDRARGELHLLRKHDRTENLDHLQCAVNEAQALDAVLHQAFVLTLYVFGQ